MIGTILLCLSNPGHWLDSGYGGGCGVLVSERTNDNAMSESNPYYHYQEELQAVYNAQTQTWELPMTELCISTSCYSGSGYGAYATAHGGIISGMIPDSRCPSLFGYVIHLPTDPGAMLLTFEPTGDEYALEVAWAPNFGEQTIIYASVRFGDSPPPSAAMSPRPPPQLPPPEATSPSTPPTAAAPPSVPSPRPVETCDILVVGNGVAGSVAKMIARDECGATKRVCSVAISAASTTTNAGTGTFFWPPALPETEEEFVLDDLETIATEYAGYVFDRARVRRTLRRFPDALDNITRVFGMKNMPVLTLPIPDNIPCTSVSCECTEAGHLPVEDLGNQTCSLSKQMYQGANCCADRETTKIDTSSTLPYHPTYDHLHGLHRYASVANFVVDGDLYGVPNDQPRPCYPWVPYDMVTMCGAAAQAGDHFYEMVVSATPPLNADGSWTVDATNTRFVASRVIFGTGGFGAHATPEERTQLGMAATTPRATVHTQTSQSSRVLVDLAEERGWTMGPFGQWGLDHINGAATWFLWHHKATVATRESSGQWRLVINEADTYNKRHRQWMAANATEGVYCYVAPPYDVQTEMEVAPGVVMNITLNPAGVPLADALVAAGVATEETKDQEASAYLVAVATNAVPKRCDSTSNRFWRNWGPSCYATYYPSDLIPVVDVDGCEMRIASTDLVTCKVLDVGIIDTTYGPAVDEFGRIVDEPTAFAIGNAAVALLSPAYLSPGSTLSNGALGGVLSAQAACSDLS